ncbi:hypothetical protein R69658_08053 [Paraburkholderia aspalathi]|uniref:H-NS histone family protein n=1 Tax=Paraburkholderia aspalathi TaxID=1324617 RepID=A0ABM8T8W5_9BURK|nr:hypothetical protein [Paraburkholderia aspalathi]CAE6869353.1 hypothetical protein R69658_08053 [Paraburkholderia aspalathi]
MYSLIHKVYAASGGESDPKRFEALGASIEEDLAHPPIYRDARGNDWNGVGPMPDWLAAAKHAGVAPDFFRIEEKPKEAPQRTRNVVYTQADLFE